MDKETRDNEEVSNEEIENEIMENGKNDNFITDTKQPLRIRPHHLMCLIFFENVGYSDGFVMSMSKIKQMLLNDDDFVLCNECDDICTNCPHCDCKCVTQEKVERYDSFVLQKCSFVVGKQYSFKEATSVVCSKIIFPQSIGQCCADCCWHYICADKAEKLSKNSL